MEREAMYAFLDRSLIVHVAYPTENGETRVIPTAFWRVNDHLYIHGSAASGTIRQLAKGVEASLCVSMHDGFVFARSGFHHSVNFRCAMVYAKGTLIDNPALKLEHLRIFMEKIAPGRWEQLRETTDGELKGTAIISFPLEEASYKVRAAPPRDEPSDADFPVWAGLVPVEYSLGEPEQDPQQSKPFQPPVLNELLYTN
jgi:nitroimidazol reductase NimA-like FMN-containing flavoprotein (pyridoxamine 5'-phosphate oxidase superfamily)